MGDEDRIRVRIDDAGLEAWASIAAGARLDRAALIARLEAVGIESGFDRSNLDRLVHALEQESAMQGELLVARGEAPTPGRPARLQLIEPDAIVAGTLREDGSLDYRERRLIVPIEEGGLIALVVPASAGKPGSTIYRTAIDPPPIAEDPPGLGEGVTLEGSRVIATRSGARVVSPDGGLSVVEMMIHAGSVDLHSGSLTTEGSLAITGDVTHGMSVRAAHDVRVDGLVDGGVIVAGGSVSVKGGALGSEAGQIRANGDLRVGHALGIRLLARGMIRVDRHVSTSHLHGREVEVHGQALSDEIVAEDQIRVQIAGSRSGAPCCLRAAVPLEGDDFYAPERITPTGNPVSESRKSSGHGRRSDRSRRRGRSARETRLELEARVAWREQQRELERTAAIVIEKEAYPGCRIEIGRARHTLEEKVHRRTYRLDLESGELVWTENKT
jgi:uncharacterized protein (DUF342 family)